jgi:hypothetical protein
MKRLFLIPALACVLTLSVCPRKRTCHRFFIDGWTSEGYPFNTPTLRRGGSPNSRLYSRLNCVGLS